MGRFRFPLLALLLLIGTATWLMAVEPYYRRADPFQLVAGLFVGEGTAPLSGITTPSAGTVQLGGSDVTTLTSLAGASVRTQDSNGFRHTPPATQTIAAGNTIAADACGAVKNITAAGAVTTSTVDSIATPAAANTNCTMVVCNVGANTITIDKNANILLVGGADVALLANSCMTVMSNGTTWRQMTPHLTAT